MMQSSSRQRQIFLPLSAPLKNYNVDETKGNNTPECNEEHDEKKKNKETNKISFPFLVRSPQLHTHFIIESVSGRNE